MLARLLLLSLLFGCRASEPAVDGLQDSPDSLIPFETTTLISEVLDGEERRVTVYLPPDYDPQGPMLPVLYLPAAEGTYLHFATSTVHILREFGDLPSMIVVGLRDINGQRDLTPTTLQGELDSGGAGRFLDHIESEVIPFVERNYRASPERRFLWGHSIAGTFGMYAFLSEPELFEGVIASSPWLIYDGEAEFLLENAPGWLASREGLVGALFYSVRDEPRLEPASEALASILQERAPANLRWEFARLTGENHRSTLPLTLPLGLRWMFGS